MRIQMQEANFTWRWALNMTINRKTNITDYKVNKQVDPSLRVKPQQNFELKYIHQEFKTPNYENEKLFKLCNTL